MYSNKEKIPIYMERYWAKDGHFSCWAQHVLTHWNQWDLCGLYCMQFMLNYYAAQGKTEKGHCFGYNMPTGSINWVQNHC